MTKMTSYKLKNPDEHQVTAVQWNKHGDHYAVSPVPSLSSKGNCMFCGKPNKNHGRLSTFRVCPGDFIVVEPLFDGFKIYREKPFLNTYEVA